MSTQPPLLPRPASRHACPPFFLDTWLIPQDFTFRWFAFQLCSFHAAKDLIEPINVVFQGRCCYDHVIHVTHHKVTVLLRHSGQSLSWSSCTGTTPIHMRIRFFSVLLPQRDLPEGRTQVQCGEELGITKFREALVYSRYRVRIFYCHRVQVAKVATKPKLPLLFFAITTPQEHGDFEGSIMSYSRNISNSARHTSDLCGVIRLAPSLWGMAPSSNYISCWTKL